MRFSRCAAAAITVVVTSAALVSGCNRSGTVSGPTAAPLNANDTVASVDGKTISQSQFFTQLQNYTANPQSPTAQQPAGRAVLQQMIGNLVVEGLAQQQGVAPTEAEVNTQFDNVKLLQGWQSIKPLEQRLQEVGLSAQDVKDLQVRPQLAQLKLLTKGQASPTPTEIKAYYDANVTKEFTKPDRAHIQGIALMGQEDAQQIYQQIQGGQTFETFLPRSLNKNMVNGEFPQWVPMDASRDPRLSALIKGVQATSPGKTTPPFSFQGAWWLIKVVEKKPKEVFSLDQVKALIPFLLTEQHATQNPQSFSSIQQQERDYQVSLAKSGKIMVNLPGVQYTQMVDDMKNPPAPQGIASNGPPLPPPTAPKAAPKATAP